MILHKLKNGMLAFYWRIVVKPHVWFVMVIVSLMFVASMLETTTIGMGVPLIEAATSSAQGTSGGTLGDIRNVLVSFGYPAEDKGKFIFALLVVVSALAILKAGFYMGHKYATAVIAQHLRRESKLKLLTKILHASYTYISTRSRGEIIYDVNYPSQALFQVIYALSNFLSNLMNAVFVISLMLYLSVPATIIIAAIGGTWLYFWRRMLGPRMSQAGRDIYGLNQIMGKADVDTIDGLKVVKSNNLEDKMLSLQKNLLVLEMRPKKRAALFSQGMLFVNEVSAGIVIVILGGVSFGLGLFHLDFARLVVLLLAVRRVSPALSAVGQTYLELRQELKSVETIEQISLHTPQERRGGLKDFSVESVRFQRLNFSYPSKDSDKKMILKEINIDACKGEAIAIVGPTGSGKSTLISILLGFYNPDAGIVAINDSPLCKIDLDYWRGKVGYVSQDVFLFHETILQNIVLWDNSIVMEEVVRAAKIAQIHEFIESLPEGYNTQVGDRGLKLSGGQCQRIAIARIMLKKPDVIIFDEATSALDNVTEKAVYNAIQSLKKETVIIIIAHRLSSLQHVDKIFVLDSGHVVERGTHASLMQESGIYSKLYKESDYRTAVQ